jgi:heme-degrading monooxygenase HmoA
MYVILWQYAVKPDCIVAFESAYGPRGDWVVFFSHGQGYLGTQLLHDTTNPTRYVTLDLWSSEEDYQRFREHNQQEYSRIDKRYESLTEQETYLGSFTRI